MTLRTMKELRRFNQVLDSCTGAVWLENTQGKRYNLLDARERLVGLARC